MRVFDIITKILDVLDTILDGLDIYSLLKRLSGPYKVLDLSSPKRQKNETYTVPYSWDEYPNFDNGSFDNNNDMEF